MATIAKLDSNGVQVLPEGQRGKTTSPQVHSSTDVAVPIDGMHFIKILMPTNKFERFKMVLLLT